MKMINEKREINWVMLSIILCTILIWYSIFKIGFFITITWLIVIACVVGIYIRLKEETIL
tara:strand:- start:207 stop:386 length:180 start_codon:yes stop_codon:yes gene_type:complete